MLTGAAVSLAFLAWTRTPLSRRAAIAFVPAGVCYGLSYVFLFEAFARGRVSVVSPIVATESLWGVTLSWLVLRKSEHVGPRLVAGAVLVVAGRRADRRLPLALDGLEALLDPVEDLAVELVPARPRREPALLVADEAEVTTAVTAIRWRRSKNMTMPPMNASAAGGRHDVAVADGGHGLAAHQTASPNVSNAFGRGRARRARRAA